MDLKLKKYINIDRIFSLQIDMSNIYQKINIEIITNAINELIDNLGDYVLKYQFNEDVFEVSLLKTTNWVDEYNKNNTMAHINVDFFMNTKFMTIHSKSQSGYNHLYKELK